jgi:thioredoxin 1
MTPSLNYSANVPDHKEIDEIQGPLVLEFGTDWCGHCQAAQPLIAKALSDHPTVKHMKIEDGKGRRLGRLHSVKLWPTLIFMRNGQEAVRLVRPRGTEELQRALAQIA